MLYAADMRRGLCSCLGTRLLESRCHYGAPSQSANGIFELHSGSSETFLISGPGKEAILFFKLSEFSLPLLMLRIEPIGVSGQPRANSVR